MQVIYLSTLLNRLGKTKFDYNCLAHHEFQN